MTNRDPGSRLTRAEKALLHTREVYERIKEHYESLEDAWNVHVEESGDVLTKARYRLLLRAEREGESDMGKAWRLYQKARHILARRVQHKALLTRRYYDDRALGFGG